MFPEDDDPDTALAPQQPVFYTSPVVSDTWLFWLLGWLIKLGLLIAILVIAIVCCNRILKRIDSLGDTVSEGDAEILEQIGVLQNATECCNGFEYDVVVVGSGPAGSAAVYWLWANTNYTVLLLEAGSDASNPAETQNFVGVDPSITANNGQVLSTRTDLFWGALGINLVAPPPYAHMVIGSTLGGGTKVNGMLEVQQSEVVAILTDAATGSTGEWSFADQQLNSAEIETFIGLNPPYPTRGTAGPQTIMETEPTVFGMQFAQAVTAFSGLPLNYDYNDGGNATGPIPGWQLSVKQNYTLRASADVELLPQALRDDPRITIQTRHRVTTVRWEGLRATGVNFVDPRGLGGCANGRAVLLATNTQNSFLLELSGVGDAALLSSIGIPVKIDNPWVGEGLLNHWGARVLFSRPLNATGLTDPSQLYPGGAFLGDPGALDDNSRHVQHILIDAGPGVGLDFFLWNRRNVTGSQHITSSSPFNTGQTVENDLISSSEGDLPFLRRVIREQIVPIMTELALIDPAYVLLTPSPSEIADDYLLDAYIKRNAGEGYNYQNTTGLGSVVDEFLQVYGAEGLFVAGSSVSPVNNDGNLQWFSRMSGWKAGKYIAAYLSSL